MLPVAFAGVHRSQKAAIIGFVVTSLVVSYLIDFQHRTLSRARSAEKAQAWIAMENARLLNISKAAQDELKASNDRLLLANQDLELFAYAASHDLKEPLRNIHICTELIEERSQGQLSADSIELFSLVRTAAARMDSLIEDILIYAGAAQRPASTPELCRPETVLADVLKILRGPIEATGATIVPGQFMPLAVDETCISRLFQNLISNSLKYRGQKPPCVQISAVQRDGWCLFSVADNGLGIDERFSSEIFKLFKRLHGRDEFPGNGIGLAVCKRMVEHYGGRIWLESSEPGKGSTFCFTLPAATKAGEELENSAQQAEHEGLGRRG